MKNEDTIKLAIAKFEKVKKESIEIIEDFITSEEFKEFAKRNGPISLGENEPDIVSLRESERGKRIIEVLQNIVESYAQISLMVGTYTKECLKEKLVSQGMSLFLEVAHASSRPEEEGFFQVLADRIDKSAKELSKLVFDRCVKEMDPGAENITVH